MGNPGLTAPLKRPAFRRLALSYAVNELGDWLGIVALSVLVFDRTGSALATALLFVGTGFLPALLTPLTVARFERPPPRFVLPTIYAGEAAAFGALALLAGHFSLAAVVVVATIDGAFALTARTLTRAVSAAMLEPHDELRAGNAILNVAFTGGAAVGPAIAGVVVAALGVQSALLLDAVSFYAIACILLTARPLPQPEPEPEVGSRERVRAGLGYIRRNPYLRRLIARPDGGDRLLLRRDPDRGDLRQGDARRRRRRLRPAARQLGRRHGGRQRRLRHPEAGAAAAAAVLQHGRDRRRLPRHGRRPDPGARLRRRGGRRRRQRRAVGGGGQRGAGADLGRHAGPGHGHARIDVLGRAGLGYLLGGAIAAAWSPRAAFLVAGAGVIAIVLASALLLGRNWPLEQGKERPGEVDAADEPMVELIPAEAVSSPDRRS